MLKHTLPLLTPLIVKMVPTNTAREMLNFLGRAAYEPQGCRAFNLRAAGLSEAVNVQAFEPLFYSGAQKPLMPEAEPSGTLVFLPGFGGIPNTRDPGVLLDVAQQHNLRFVRFYHPHMLEPDKLTYKNMINEAAAVVESQDGPVVLAGSSFGGGMAHLVADEVNNRAREAGLPDKVVGLYAWSAVTPDAVIDLIRAQPAYEKFANKKEGRITFQGPTQTEPMSVSWAQIMGVNDHATYRKQVSHFNHPALYETGDADPVSNKKDVRKVTDQLGPRARFQLLSQTGHAFSKQQLEAGLTKVVEDAGFAKVTLRAFA